ncbi:MAG: FAD-dependent oxidoreductase [Gemmatimonadota bacterium]|nr:FAD-dependent oxidoreductase [Gemmatimonadota bacterium]
MTVPPERTAGIGRREFLARAVGAPLVAAPLVAVPLALAVSACAVVPRRGRSPAADVRADLVIIGGGLGGCAAALAAANRGLRVIMTEETDWIGGQLTQQGVPPDENAWIETIGGTRRYLALRTGIREHYRRHAPLTERARANARLNPGSCWVSRLGAEPTVALAVLHEQLAPYVANGQLTILRRHRAVAADVHRDRVQAVHLHDRPNDRRLTVHAPYFLDATELGDLLPLTGTEYVTGAESRAQTGEPHAKDAPEPDNVQSFTMCFAMEHRDGEQHVIDRPPDYAAWRDLAIPAADGVPYRLLSFDEPANARIGFDPVARTGYWSYRRVIDRDLFVRDGNPSGRYAHDVTIVNWGLNDYSFGSLIDVSEAEAQAHIARATEQGRSLLYWLQTEAPRPNGGAGWPGLRLRPDILGTNDGFAQYPYIRESRRIAAAFTVCEQHVTTPTTFADSVGIGHYSMDLHRTTRGDYGRYGTTIPFQIPLGALLPKRMENLLPAAKNIGTTHLSNGCYRLHPVEWNIGESAGALVAFALARRLTPRAVHANAEHRRDFQQELQRDGVPLAWPDPLPK